MRAAQARGDEGSGGLAAVCSCVIGFAAVCTTSCRSSILARASSWSERVRRKLPTRSLAEETSSRTRRGAVLLPLSLLLGRQELASELSRST